MLALQISEGMEFQRAGAATQKAPSPKVCSLVWGTNGEQAFVNGPQVLGGGSRDGEGQVGTVGIYNYCTTDLC